MAVRTASCFCGLGVALGGLHALPYQPYSHVLTGTCSPGTLVLGWRAMRPKHELAPCSPHCVSTSRLPLGCGDAWVYLPDLVALPKPLESFTCAINLAPCHAVLCAVPCHVVPAQEMMAQSKHLEDGLMALCSEKGQLEAEFSRMPLHAGRTIKERTRKAVVEQRLEILNKDISAVRLHLKKLHGK